MLAAVCIALGCSTCYVGTHYQGWQYRGGRFTNHGLLTRPRYVAQFPEISLDLPASYTYTFSRFPASDAGVVLETPSGPAEGAVRRLTTQLRIRVEDQNRACFVTAAGRRRDEARIRSG